MKNEVAILMAAGLGTRMRPLTNTTPKPLIEINGKPMIETLLEALNKRKVKKIYIVVGYLKEKFQYLMNKYDNVILVENKDYNIKNNISSIYTVKDIMKEHDCFICEADLVIVDENVLLQDINNSCYFAKKMRGFSDDWGFDINDSGNITRIYKGVTDAYNMVGISYFKQKEATVIANRIEVEYEKEGSENLYWDEVVDMCLDDMSIKINEIKDGMIVELDTVDELKEFINNAKVYIS